MLVLTGILQAASVGVVSLAAVVVLIVILQGSL